MSEPEYLQIERLQNQVLSIGESVAQPITAATQAAFRAVPRHRFVTRYRAREKIVTVTPETLSQHLPTIYANGVLSLWEDKENGIYSTISQPTLVLQMLDFLKLADGQTVFELGAGSGWNAALMGYLVGPKGRVFSMEIIPEIADAARKAVADFGATNVEIITGDAGDGCLAGAPYDRAVFTAGSYDLPRALHDQMRVGGILLMVVKVEGGGDQLLILEKKAAFFESSQGILCAFVPMTGKHACSGSRPICIDELPGWSELRTRQVEQRGFWWGGNVEGLSWSSVGIRSFLSITDPHFRVFYERGKNALDPRDWFCGVFDADAQSLVVSQNGLLVSYGNFTARDQLFARLHEWVDFGMPSMAAMNLRVYPSNAEAPKGPQQWIVKRNESTFVWSLKQPAK